MVRFIILLYMSLPLNICAQYQIKGSVSKSDGSVISSITAILKKQGAADVISSVSTDSTGSFTFRIAEPGNYVLNFQSLFYRDTSIFFSVTTMDKFKDLGSIKVRDMSQTLKTVTVTAKKEAIEFKEDHIAFNPGADASIGSRPVTEILNRIPGISIDSKNSIIAKGQEGVQLLVNERIIRTPAFDYLAQLNADEVERIELYDNATRFAYIKAPIIINVVLKTKQPKKLWNAALNTNTLPRLNPSVDAGFSIGKRHRIYSRFSHDISSFRTIGYLTRSFDSIHFYQDYDRTIHHKMTTVRLGWEYYHDSASTLTIEGSYTRHTDGLRSNIKVKNAADQFENIIRTAPVENEMNGFITYGRNKKEKGHKMLEVSVTRFNLRNERTLPGLLLTEERDMNNYAFGFKAEWQENIKTIKILNGVFGQLVKITDQRDTLPFGPVLQSKFSNNSVSSYHEANWQWQRWSFAVGANIDYIHMELNASDRETFTYQRTFINPTVRLNTSKGKNRTSLTYNRKYVLPAAFMMFGQYSQDEYGRSAPGNYSLKPAIQDLVKLSYTSAKKATILFELYYDLTQNPVVMLNHVNGNIIIERPENLKNRKSIGTVFSISYAIRPYYSFTFNMDGRINNHEFNENIYALNPQTWSGSATLNNRFTVNKKLSLSLNTSLHNWRTTLYRDIQGLVTFAIQGNYKMNPRTNISFGLNDIFNNMRFSYFGAIAPGYYETGFSSSRMRNISISIRYQLINSQLDKKTSTVKSFMSE